MNMNYDESRAEALQGRFGLRVAARLSAGAEALPHDIGERLRVARQQALAQRRQPKAAARLRRAPLVASHDGGTASLGFGDEALGFWGRLASGALVLALAIGLVAVNIVQDDDRAIEVADLDSALLIDDLPPAAYADPGFLRYLKTTAQDSSASR
ncbi:MAG: DUF3619 family protein [Burkholderiales bacterium]|nr:DUF3619 family protein [Burkholderiales bacterium]